MTNVNVRHKLESALEMQSSMLERAYVFKSDSFLLLKPITWSHETKDGCYRSPNNNYYNKS